MSCSSHSGASRDVQWTLRLSLITCCLSSLALGILGCDDEAPSSSPLSPPPPLAGSNVGGPDILGDYDVFVDPRGDYGEPCQEDSDCIDRACVTLGEGKVCSKSCTLECEPFPNGEPAYCRSIEGDRKSVV